MSITETLLSNPTAAMVAERFATSLHEAELAYDGALRPLGVSDEVRLEFREKYPDRLIVRSEALQDCLFKAALRGAGFTYEEVPEGLIEQIRFNQDALSSDTRDLFEGELDGVLTAISHGFYALPIEKIIELVAYHYGLIGPLSLDEYNRGDADDN